MGRNEPSGLLKSKWLGEGGKGQEVFKCTVCVVCSQQQEPCLPLRLS